MRVRDMFPNRHYETWNAGAALTTCTYSSFDLIAGGIAPYMAWMIERVEFAPAVLLNAGFTSPVTTRFQLCTGEQTALLQSDDENVVCTKDLIVGLATNGGVVIQCPLTWMGPVLVAARKMTVLMDSGADFPTAWQSQKMICTIWFRWVEMNQDTWYEVMQAKGILT